MQKKHHSINSVNGALDNFNVGDNLSLDLGDTLIVGHFRGFRRVTIEGSNEIKYYIKIKVSGRREMELVCPRDYPEMKIARLSVAV